MTDGETRGPDGEEGRLTKARGNAGGGKAAARRVAVFAALLGVVSGAAGALAWRSLFEMPEVTDPTPVEFRVRPREGFRSVAKRLEEAGLVVSALRLRILARVRREDRTIRAGTYVFAPGSDPRKILEDLVAGNVRLLRFTVPEGWRLEQIAEEAERVLGVPVAGFRRAASDSTLRARLECPTPDVEGYLFPETYLFPDGAAPREIVRTMTDRFVEVFEGLSGEIPEGLTRHDVVTLASIVEAETYLVEEKPRVAAVYLNRLSKGWKLQADPTVRYALGRFRGRLYYKHLDVDSPYNTYRTAGVPPGPIGSPGREALQAVLTPLEPCHDFYFVASGDGGHTFSRTKAEHDRARLLARAGADAPLTGETNDTAAEAPASP
jgi:UPF0755 protein